VIGIVEKREISGISGPMVSQDDNFYRLCRECVYLCCKTLALMPPLYCRRCATKPPRDSRFAVTSIMHSGARRCTSKQYLTATVTWLVVAILFSPSVVILRSIAAPGIDGKISADAVHLKTLP
jgi:hypothetical protein